MMLPSAFVSFIFLSLRWCLIFRDQNGNVIAQTTLLAKETGLFVLSNSITALVNDTVSVMLSTDSPIDISQIQVSASPVVVCITSDVYMLRFVFDGIQMALLKQSKEMSPLRMFLFPQYIFLCSLRFAIDQYPLTFSTSPLSPYKADVDGVFPVSPRISYDGTSFPVIVTIKSNGTT